MKIRSLLPAVLLTAASAQADEIRYEWEAVPNAAYYSGTMTKDDDTTRVRTTETWLLLEEGNVLKLEAFDADGEVLAPVHIAGASPALPRPPVAAPKAEPPPPPPAQAAPPPEPEVALPKPPPPRPAMHLSLHIGFGKEWLTATGGVSDYEGSANIGGTILHLDKGDADSHWFFDATVAIHNYSTSTEERDSAGSSGGESESKFLRLAAGAGGFYDFGGTPAERSGYRLALGLGLAAVRLPMLATYDRASGTAELEQQSAAGPFVGVVYERHLSDLIDLGVRAEYLPLSLTKPTKAMSTNAYAYWRYTFAGALYTELGIASEYTATRMEFDCPAVSGCRDESRATSKVVQARMGLGVAL